MSNMLMVYLIGVLFFFVIGPIAARKFSFFETFIILIWPIAVVYYVIEFLLNKEKP